MNRSFVSNMYNTMKINNPIQDLYIHPKPIEVLNNTYSYYSVDYLLQRFINEWINVYIIKPSLFFNKMIVNDIQHNVKQYSFIQWKIQHIQFELWLGHYKENTIRHVDIQDIIQIMNDILIFIIKYGKLNNQTYTFIFIPTPHKKCVPKNNNQRLTSYHINSGFTQFNIQSINELFTPNSVSVIYRYQDWVKVFIHECFHLFKFDHSLYQIKKQPLYETYCEFWALWIFSIYKSHKEQITFNQCLTNTIIKYSKLWSILKTYPTKHPNVIYYYKYPINILYHLNKYMNFISKYHSKHNILNTPKIKKYNIYFKNLLEQF